MTARWTLVACFVLAGCAVTPINIPNSDSGPLEARDQGRVVEIGAAPSPDASSRADAGTISKGDAAARDGFPVPGGDARSEGPRPDLSGVDGTVGKDAKPKTDKGKTGD